MSDLDTAWSAAEAALPRGWELRGVAKGPREVDPRIDAADWTAWAKPAEDDADYRAVGRVAGRGLSATEALAALESELRALAATSGT